MCAQFSKYILYESTKSHIWATLVVWWWFVTKMVCITACSFIHSQCFHIEFVPKEIYAILSTFLDICVCEYDSFSLFKNLLLLVWHDDLYRIKFNIPSPENIIKCVYRWHAYLFTEHQYYALNKTYCLCPWSISPLVVVFSRKNRFYDRDGVRPIKI